MNASTGPHCGVALDIPASRIAAFWERVMKADGCWLWTGTRQNKGYGFFALRRGENRLAHRVAYTLVRGPIPKGALVMHTCDNPLCVNPEHLWIGTQADNLRDMRRKGRAPDYAAIIEKKMATHCVRGHRRTPTNTKVVDGKKVCRTCEQINRRNAEAAAVREAHALAIETSERITEAVAAHVAPFAPTLFTDLTLAIGSARDADVFARYFGLYGYRHFALEEIGVEYGITRERARQIRNRAMKAIGLDVDAVMSKMPQPSRATMEKIETLNSESAA